MLRHDITKAITTGLVILTVEPPHDRYQSNLQLCAWEVLGGGMQGLSASCLHQRRSSCSVACQPHRQVMECIEMERNGSSELRLGHCPIPRYRFRRELCWQDVEDRKWAMMRRMVRYSTLKEAVHDVKPQALPLPGECRNIDRGVGQVLTSPPFRHVAV
jgi:hypothetical protein